MLSSSSFRGQKDPRQPCLVLLKADAGPAGGLSRGRAAAQGLLLSHLMAPFWEMVPCRVSGCRMKIQE